MKTQFTPMVDPTKSLWHLLAHELRFRRCQKGWTLARVGRVVGKTEKAVSHWEVLRAKPPLACLRKLDAEWITGGALEYLYLHAADKPEEDWYKTYRADEDRARVVKSFSATVIGPLLQTEGYMRALWAVDHGKPIDIEAAASERLSRQASVLGRPNPPLLWAVMDEAVLRMPVGGRQVMHDQYAALLEASELRHVVIRVVPDSAKPHDGLGEAFQVISVDASDIVLIASRGTRTILAFDEVEGYKERFDRISARALSPEDTRSVIRHLMMEYAG